MQRIVAFDEAGNTGNDLLNPRQPVFTLASVDLPLGVARALTQPGGRELHFKSARKSAPGRQQILRVLSDGSLSSQTVRSVAAHKPFSVVAKMIDVLVEPLAAAHGYDLYADGAHRALSNLLFAVLPPVAGVDATSSLYAAFVQMCRVPTAESKSRFVDSVNFAAQSASGELDRELSLLVQGSRLDAFGGGGLPDLDPAPPCLISLAHAWSADRSPFAILHDARPELQRWERAVAPFWQERTNSTTFVLYNGSSLTYPLPITSLTAVASHEDPRIQVADVVAGALHLVLQDQAGVATDPRFAALLQTDTPLLEWVVDAVWPTVDMDPDALDVRPGATPYLADAIVDWTRGGL